MKTNNLIKASIGNLIGVFNTDYIYNVNDIVIMYIIKIFRINYR